MLDRTKAPPQKDLQAINLPTASIYPLSGGGRIHVLQNDTQPVIRIEVVLKAGKWYEPQPAVSFLLSKMLMGGTSHYPAKKLAEAIAYYGASLECQHGYDRFTITLYCLSKYVPNLLPILQEVVFSPTLDSEELQLQKNIALQNLRVEHKKNSYLATKQFTQNLYGSLHPYSVGVEENQLVALTAANLKDFHLHNFRMSNAEVFVSGDANEIIVRMLQDAFNRIESPSLTHGFNEGEASAGSQKDQILIKDSLQSSIRVGCKWPSLNELDYHKLSLLNKVLGGYFGSRLMRNIREDKGFTYGIYSSLSPKEHGNMFSIGTDVNYKSTNLTLEEIYKEINLLKENLIPEEELDTVRKYTIGKFLGDTNTIFEQADRYKTLIFHNLPANFYEAFINDVTYTQPEELLELAQLHWPEEAFYEVIAGKRP